MGELISIVGGDGYKKDLSRARKESLLFLKLLTEERRNEDYLTVALALSS